MSTDTTREAVERRAARIDRYAEQRMSEAGNWALGSRLAAEVRAHASTIAGDAATLRALLAERDGLDALIGRMQAQDVAAIQQWQAANPGNDLVWPDNIRLTAWCMGEVARCRAERDASRAEAERMRGLLKRAREELRLIHMKDTGAIYDVGIRIEMDMALWNAALAGTEGARDG